MVVSVKKDKFTCGMCKTYKESNCFTWVSIITENELKICQKCAERENGKKYIKELLNTSSIVG